MTAGLLRTLFIAAIAIPLAACATEDGDATDEIDVEGKADADIRVRVDGLTVWIDPAITRADGERPWRLHGRTSRNLEGVMSFVPDDEYADAEVRSPRTFEIAFDDRELATIAAGLPLFLSITPTTGNSATAAIWIGPRVGDFTGTSNLRVDSTVTPRWIGGDAVFRGGARTDAGWVLRADGPSAPQVFAETTADRFRLDWTTTTFFGGAVSPFQFHVRSGADLESKQARPQFVVRRLGITRDDAYEVWPGICGTSVRTCLDGLPAGTADASACGTYQQVEDCGGLPI